MKRHHLLSLLLILSVSGCSYVPEGHEYPDGFDPYISAIPDSMATGSQIKVKKALENIIYTGISVKDDRYVFHFTKDDFNRLGISEKYCKWLKRNMKKEAGNYRKFLRQNPDLKSGASRKEIFEAAKKEYLENPEKSTEQVMPMTDIFRYGSPVKCPEDNIKNLFGNWMIKQYDFEECFFLENARKFRAELKCPLVYVGGLVSREGIERVLDSGFELVQMARALVNDPAFVNKLKEGDMSTRSGCDHRDYCIARMYSVDMKCCHNCSDEIPKRLWKELDKMK